MDHAAQDALSEQSLAQKCKLPGGAGKPFLSHENEQVVPVASVIVDPANGNAFRILVLCPSRQVMGQNMGNMVNVVLAHTTEKKTLLPVRRAEIDLVHIQLFRSVRPFPNLDNARVGCVVVAEVLTCTIVP
ncbi:hypothetical protein [Burkholderia multivorans]|uniref:hypothetical protein n=1 Tax=Burkholderia multivorans TaxID=87883 RepID=UPI000CFFA115|nr:hypothetical protein [Burkholderia multivorans]